jgi:hypothetical protein
MVRLSHSISSNLLETPSIMSQDVCNLSESDHDDEFFGGNCYATSKVDDESSEDTFDCLTIRDDIAVKERHKTFGYHESYEHYENFKLQDGFVAGYQDTFSAACRIGEMLGQLVFKSMALPPGCRCNDNDDSCYNHRRAAGRIRKVLESITDTDDSENTTASNFSVREQLEQLEKEIREKFSGKVNDSGSAA